MKPRVGVLTNIPSPYQVELFDAIARRGRIDLRVWYCAEQDSRRLWERQQPGHSQRFGSGLRIETRRGNWYLDPRPALEIVRWRPDLAVLSVYPIPVVQLAMWYASLVRLPWVYWGEAVASGGSGWLRRTARNLALFPIRRWAVGLFGVGHKGVENFRKMFGQDRSVFLMPYFSNLERFTPLDTIGVQRDETRFLFVGSFIHRKGVDILSQAFSELVDSKPNVRLVVAGEGDTGQSFDSLLSPAAAARVTRCGFVPWGLLPQLYRKADFLVMPSRYDGWGLVVPEAMASGLPVIGSVDAGATVDLVRDGVTGWQVRSGDAQQLASAMRHATTLARAEVVGMRRNCVMRARRYDVSVGARVFERAVNRVLRNAMPQ